jgi:MFS transporter, SHS family, lactate transporter
MPIAALSGWTSEQKHVVAASFLGWALDAFDFFLMVFVLTDIAKEFDSDVTDVTVAILLTLAMRPIGAFLFGRAADHFGRRPTLMVNIALYSVLEFTSGFAPSLTALLILRALYGVAMGGEWGVGASLTMESIPTHARGFVSGLLQSGYPAGYFLASIVYACCSSISAGVECSWSGCCRLCWCSISDATSRSRRSGSPLRRQAARSACSNRIGASVSMRFF